MKILKFLKPDSLKYQLLSRTLFVIAILFVVIGLFQYALMKNFLYANKAASIEGQIDAIPTWDWQNINKAHATSNRNTLFELETPGSTIAFISPNGKFHDLFEDNFNIGKNNQVNDNSIDIKAPQLSKQMYQKALTNLSDMSYEMTKDALGNNALLVLHRIGGRDNPIGVVQVSTPTRPLQDILIRQLSIFAFLVAFALVVGLITFLPILRRTLVPLSQMIRTVSKINAGNLDERFSTTRAQTEIKLLSLSFNDMLERLENSFETERRAKERIRQFVADASHELRTPLTSIHGFIEVLLRGAARDPIKLDRALRSMYGESERVNKLVQDLLFLARLDQEPTFTFRSTRMDNLILSMESQLRLLAGHRKVTFLVFENIIVNCDTDKIKQVILNLFQNAVQHTDNKTGEIKVSLTKDVAGAQISIQDNGIGIPEEHKSQLFERFYRVDPARSRKHGGFGLGLSITQTIVEHHGGKISLDSELGKGTLFSVWLPIK